MCLLFCIRTRVWGLGFGRNQRVSGLGFGENTRCVGFREKRAQKRAQWGLGFGEHTRSSGFRALGLGRIYVFRVQGVRRKHCLGHIGFKEKLAFCPPAQHLRTHQSPQRCLAFPWQWRSLPPMSARRYGCAAATVNGLLHGSKRRLPAFEAGALMTIQKVTLSLQGSPHVRGWRVQSRCMNYRKLGPAVPWTSRNREGACQWSKSESTQKICNP